MSYAVNDAQALRVIIGAVEGLDEHIGAIRDRDTLTLLMATWIYNAGFRLVAVPIDQKDATDE